MPSYVYKLNLRYAYSLLLLLLLALLIGRAAAAATTAAGLLLELAQTLFADLEDVSCRPEPRERDIKEG